jgi:hypothetical protein
MLPPIATSEAGRILRRASIGGEQDYYTGVILDAFLRNLESASTATVAVASKFIYGIQPTISAAFSNISLDSDAKFKTITIDNLITLKLSTPLSAIIEPDDDAFIVRCPDLPIFGFADDPIEAISSLKREIESLYYELMEDDNYSPQWLKYKAFLRDKILAS